jgi:hypothetical protein
VTPANVNIGNTFTVIINGKSITVQATAATVANVTALLAAAIAATTIAEFAEVTAADITTAVTLTANTPGAPFTQTSSASGGTATNITATTAANSGPNVWDLAANWSTAVVPVNSDDVYISGPSSILYGLAQSAVTLTSLNILGDFTGTIGLPLINESGGYYEYRANRLAIGTSTLNIGKGAGSGSGRIRLSLGAVTTAINVYTTGAAIDAYGAIDIKGHGSNTYTCNLFKGSIAFATEPSDVALLVINQGYQDNQAGDVALYLGVGVTLTTMVQSGGAVKALGAATTYTMIGGTANVIGTGTITTLTIDSGTFVDQSSGTFTTLKVGKDGVYDRSQDQRAKTITNSTVEAGATFLDPNKTITFTNAMALNRCKLSEVMIDWGSHFNLQRS